MNINKEEMLIKSVTDILDGIDQLTNKYDLTVSERQSLIERTIPESVAQEINDINEEFEAGLQDLREKISALEAEGKSIVAKLGKTIKGERWSFVWRRPITRWDSKKLEQLSKHVEEINEARKPGNPSVSMVKNKGKM